MQLCWQSSRWRFSSFKTASAASAQRSLVSLQPASLHRLAMELQKRRTSSALRNARFERTRRQSSLANTQVLTYLNSSSVCCRISLRVSSNYSSLFLSFFPVSFFSGARCGFSLFLLFRVISLLYSYQSPLTPTTRLVRMYGQSPIIICSLFV